MKKLFHLTQDGKDRLAKELESLIGERPDIAERIAQARQLGDLSENHEYQAARTEQDRLEARISEIDHILNNSEIIKKPKGGKKVQLGSTVKLKDGGATTKQFTIVGTVEADPLNGKISDESPIGKELMGKSVGDSAKLKNPSEAHTYKIIDIA